MPTGNSRIAARSSRSYSRAGDGSNLRQASIVVRLAPAALSSGTWLDGGVPSIWTVQRRIGRCRQPYFVPVIPNGRAVTHSSGVDGSASTLWCARDRQIVWHLINPEVTVKYDIDTIDLIVKYAADRTGWARGAPMP